MKMKDSMDQMEFDRGNPQEDAPRRVQKRKKLNWKPVWFAVTAAVLAAVLLVASLTDTTAFDGLRRSITYARACFCCGLGLFGCVFLLPALFDFLLM